MHRVRGFTKLTKFAVHLLDKFRGNIARAWRSLIFFGGTVLQGIAFMRFTGLSGSRRDSCLVDSAHGLGGCYVLVLVS